MTIHSNILELFNAGYYTKAITLSLKSSDSLHDDPFLAKIVAGCYFQIGEFSSAIQLLGSLESIFYSDLDYLSLYAASCRRVGDFTKSQSLFERALQLSPQSLSIKNNYANLLIDLKKFKEAKRLLQSVIKENPSHPDATVNINRLEFIQSKLKENSNPSGVDFNSKNLCSLADPLLLAFADSEVAYASKRYKLSVDSSAKTDFPAVNHDSSAADLLKLAEDACKNKNFKFALKLCSQSLHAYGPSAQVYDCVSDAYINLKLFFQAEICLLHSIVIGGETPKRLLNLVTFSCMRSDFKLAQSYLEKVAALDPSHPQLAAISKNVYEQNNVHPFNFNQSWTTPELKSDS